MNTITENLKDLQVVPFFLNKITEANTIDGAPSQPINYSTPDYDLTLTYSEELYTDSEERDLNSPTVTFKFTEANYTKLPEYISWLIDLTIELVAETTNNDACGWSLDIQTREAPDITVSITVTDDLS